MKNLEERNYQLVVTLTQFNTAITHLSIHPILSLDLETYVLREHKGLVDSALDPHTSGISLLAIAIPDHPITYILDIIKLDKLDYPKADLLNLLATRTHLLVFNASFECKFLKKYFSKTFRNFWCCRVAAQLIGNATSSKFMRGASGYSLKDIARDYLNITLTGKDTERIQDWYIRPEDPTTIPEWWDKKLQYVAGDVQYLYSLYTIMYRIIVTPQPTHQLEPIQEWGLGMERILKLEMDFISVVGEMEFYGLPYSQQIGSKINDGICDETHQAGEMMRLSGELAKSFNLPYHSSLYAPYPIAKPEAIKVLNSPQKLPILIKEHTGITLTKTESRLFTRFLDLLEQQTKEGADFVTEEEEEMFGEIVSLEQDDLKHHSEILRNLISYKRLFKMQSMKLHNSVNPITKRIHSRYNSLGAATGRCIAAGQKVLTTKGYKPIEEVTTQDIVYCYDSLDCITTSPVIDTFYQGRATVWKLEFEYRTQKTELICTPEHRIKIACEYPNLWMEAQDLVKGTEVTALLTTGFTDEPGYFTYTFIDGTPYEEHQDVYDLSVLDYQNFICQDICVHNSASSNPNAQNISSRTHVIIELPQDKPFTCDSIPAHKL